MKKNLFTRIILLSLFLGLFSNFGVSPAQALANTSVVVTTSNSSPNTGDSVVFTITITRVSGTTPISGEVEIAHSRGRLCSTSTFTETSSGSDAFTGSCTWVAKLGYENVLAKYKGDSNYSSSNSAYITDLAVIGVTDFSLSRTVEGNNMAIKAWANANGVMDFKMNGSVISGCSSVSVTNNVTVNCTYALPSTPTNSADSTRFFSVDFTPTSKSKIVDAHTKVYTPDAYYFPHGDNLYSSIRDTYVNATSAKPYRDSHYVEIDHIFYKLNRSSLEAMVVGYDRFASISVLTVPSSINVIAGSGSGMPTDFIGTYEVGTIGTFAFKLQSGSPSLGATLLRSIILPDTIKVIADEAFSGQCGIATLNIPDSVKMIGTDAFYAMNSTGANTGSGYSGCTGDASTGLQNLTLGAGVNSFGSYPFYAARNLTNVVFRGAPSDLISLNLYRNSSFDQWEFTDVLVGNYSLRHPINDYSRNTCSLFFVYAGTLKFSILATQNSQWGYWAQGCLSGTLTLEASNFKPSQPSAPVISTIGRSSIQISISSPSSNGGSSLTSYSVFYSSNDWATSTLASSTIDPNLSTFTVTGLLSATTYKFKVTAKNSIGESIASPTSISAKTLVPIAPEPPTIGAVTRVSATSISVPYTAGAINGSAITSYTTTASPTIADLTLTSTATANPLTYSGTFVQGQAYTFSMTATNGAGTSSSSGSSTPITPYSASVPATGIIGSVTRSSDTSVSIPFTAPSANGSAITGYTITSSPALALTYSGTSSPMAVTGAFVQGQSYTFTIAATNGAGIGAASSSSNAITPFAAARPDAPTIGTATLVDSQTVTVSFTAPLNNRGSAITSYKATSTPGAITATSTGSPITVTGLTVNTSYTFTVTATNLIGESDSSTATSAVTPLMSYSVTFNSQSGSTVSDGTFISGSTVAAPSSTPTRSGYTFNGWFSASTGGSALVFPYAPGVTNAVTLYAQWTLVPVVVPVVVPPVVQTGPPPSILKSLTAPKVTKDASGFYCEIGTYVFLRDGRTEELPKLTSRVFSLQLNGKIIESIKSTLDKVAFTKHDLSSNSTVHCQVEAGQENLVTTTSSLNSALMSKFSMERKSAIEAAYVKYYKDRTDAYAKKSQVFARILLEKIAAMNVAKSSKARISASIAYQKAFSSASNTWKKELVEATKNRDLSKALAQKIYLESLEAAGISIYQS